MSETDDIFDIDEFLIKKAPGYIKDAWHRHVKYFNRCEKDAEVGAEVIGAIATLKDCIAQVGRK